MWDIKMTLEVQTQTQDLPPAIQTLKSIACAKDLGASNHVCNGTATEGVSPSSTGDHTLSAFAACTPHQDEIHFVQ
jgi:hypothetical protein